jgi:conjugative transfer signal peptidase TraF
MKAVQGNQFILRTIKLLGLFIVFLAALIFAVSIWMRVNHIYINTTPSLPVGLYKKIHSPIEKGVYVAFCPPEWDVFMMAQERGFISASNGMNGNCPSGHGLMLKQVMALQGDTVSIDSSGVSINGKKLPLSEQLSIDDRNLPLPLFSLKSRQLDASEALLMANIHPRSFDARYFGLVDRIYIVTRVKPWIIFFNK